MGGNMVMVGDFVTRKSYNNDIVFKVIDIEGDICYLCGVSIRLHADSFHDDLVIVNGEDFEEDFKVDFDEKGAGESGNGYYKKTYFSSSKL